MICVLMSSSSVAQVGPDVAGVWTVERFWSGDVRPLHEPFRLVVRDGRLYTNEGCTRGAFALNPIEKERFGVGSPESSNYIPCPAEPTSAEIQRALRAPLSVVSRRNDLLVVTTVSAEILANRSAPEAAIGNVPELRGDWALESSTSRVGAPRLGFDGATLRIEERSWMVLTACRRAVAAMFTLDGRLYGDTFRSEATGACRSEFSDTQLLVAQLDRAVSLRRDGDVLIATEPFGEARFRPGKGLAPATVPRPSNEPVIGTDNRGYSMKLSDGTTLLMHVGGNVSVGPLVYSEGFPVAFNDGCRIRAGIWTRLPAGWALNGLLELEKLDRPGCAATAAGQRAADVVLTEFSGPRALVGGPNGEFVVAEGTTGRARSFVPLGTKAGLVGKWAFVDANPPLQADDGSRGASIPRGQIEITQSMFRTKRHCNRVYSPMVSDGTLFISIGFISTAAACPGPSPTLDPNVANLGHGGYVVRLSATKVRLVGPAGDLTMQRIE